MKNPIGLSVLAISILAGACSVQNDSPPYEIATWRGFRQMAMSHTYDDNTSNQLPVAVPLYDSLGFPLTLFTVTTWSPDWLALAAAAANGHEIASHTVSHQYLNTLSDSLEDVEQGGSAGAIEANIPGADGLTIAYPYCVRGTDVITSKYYIAARGCSGQIEPPTPADWLDVSSLIIGTEGPFQSGAELIALADSGAATGGWMVLLMHGVDDDGGWSPVASSALREFLRHLRENDTRFWVETFGNVTRYIRERDAASIIEVSADESAIEVQVTDSLDDGVYDYPITIRRELPEGWEAVSGVQDGEPIRAEIAEMDSKRYIVFDAVPDGGPVVLRKVIAGTMD